MKLPGTSITAVIVGIALGAWGLVIRSQTLDATVDQVVVLKPVNGESDSSVRPEEDADILRSCEPSQLNPPLTAMQVLRCKIALLERGQQLLQSTPGYTAEFAKQEIVNGELLDEQTIFIKCRHQPFSVYLLWITAEPGREAIYVEGSNNGHVIAHGGGWKSRLPALSLPPQSSLAMADARYPVTAAGLLGLLKIMLPIHHDDLSRFTVETCELDDRAECEGRPCWRFTTHYKNRDVSPQYRKSITLIDQEWKLPVSTRHFDWPDEELAVQGDLDEATLIESYAFKKIDLHAHLSDHDFDRGNKDYQFR